MTLTIELPPEREAALRVHTHVLGLSPEEWLVQLADWSVPAVSLAHLQKTDPEEWGRHFRAWVESHDPNTPVLSDEAMSRKSINPDRT